jgi:hypothetical protein
MKKTKTKKPRLPKNDEALAYIAAEARKVRARRLKRLGREWAEV